MKLENIAGEAAAKRRLWPISKTWKMLTGMALAFALQLMPTLARASESYVGCINKSTFLTGDTLPSGMMTPNCLRSTVQNVESVGQSWGLEYCDKIKREDYRCANYLSTGLESMIENLQNKFIVARFNTERRDWLGSVLQYGPWYPSEDLLANVGFTTGCGKYRWVSTLNGQITEGEGCFDLLLSKLSYDGLNFTCPPALVSHLQTEFYEATFQNSGVVCFPVLDAAPPCETCEAGFGNPIFPGKGAKKLDMSLGIDDLRIAYDTGRKYNYLTEDGKPKYTIAVIRRVLGGLWSPSWLESTKKLTIQTGRTQLQYQAGSHREYMFDGVSGARLFANGTASFGVGGALPTVFHSDGAVSWFLQQDVFQKFDATGPSKTYTYAPAIDLAKELPAAGLLSTITPSMGAPITFGYQKVGEVDILLSWVSQAGKKVNFEYTTAGYLRKITWPDGKVREFLYEDARFPWAITGEIHEDGLRFSTYVYDADGLATETYTGDKQNHFKANWASKPVLQTTSEMDSSTGLMRRTRTWQAGSGTTVTSPLGDAITLETQSILGTNRITSRSQPAGSGCTAADAESGYDARGNVISAKDFASRRSCMAYDAVRPLETLRLEGRTEDCPANLATYAIPTTLKADEPQRLIHTQWHPMWAKQVRVAEPKRITTTVYNGQPDPLNSGAISNCVPAGAVLPVGETLGSTTPLAVVCKRYEQATNDNTGQLGFTAAETGRRSWSYVYNARGQVTKATDPVGQVTDYTYFESADFTGTGKSELGETMGHHVGDLNTFSLTVNGIKQTTTHTHYNQWGQVLRSVLPNGNVEERAYNARGALRLVRTRPVNGSADSLLTEYTYHPTGLLDKQIQPDGRWLKHHYDESRRLTKVEDQLGNLVEYALDGAGNRLQEKHLDAQGVRQKLIVRTYDALSRLQTETLVP